VVIEKAISTASASEAGDPSRRTLRRAVAASSPTAASTPATLLSVWAPHLTAKVILQLSRTTPERQRFEVEQILLGRRPFSDEDQRLRHYRLW